MGFRSLEVGPLVRVCGWGLGPARWPGSPSVEVGPWVGGVGAGLGLCTQEGGSEGRGSGPGAQQSSRCLSGQGTHWPCCLPFLHAPPPPSPPGSPPQPGWVPLGVGTPPLPQPPLRGAGPGGLAFTFAPPSLPPTPSGPAQLEGASVGRGSGLGLQQAPRGPSGHGKSGHAPF